MIHEGAVNIVGGYWISRYKSRMRHSKEGILTGGDR